MCVRCKKRPAAVFITRNENGKTTNEGLCFVCAHEIGVKPLDNMLKQMGMSEETIESMAGELEDAMAEVSENMMDVPEQDDGGAPAIDFNKFFSGLGFGPQNAAPFGEKGGKKEKAKKDAVKENEKKFLNMYCSSLSKKAGHGGFYAQSSSG